MKIINSPIIIYLIGIFIIYGMWSFYWLTFDFSKWEDMGRASFLIFGNLIALIYSLSKLMFSYLDGNRW